MGHARALADRIDLAALAPRGDLSSTGYCLARPGAEYLAYLPVGGQATVDLTAASGALQVEWICPLTGVRQPGETLAGGGKRTVTAPFAGQAVLRLSAPRGGTVR